MFSIYWSSVSLVIREWSFSIFKNWTIYVIFCNTFFPKSAISFAYLMHLFTGTRYSWLLLLSSIEFSILLRFWLSSLSPLFKVSKRNTFCFTRVSVCCLKYFNLNYNILFSFFNTSFEFSDSSNYKLSYFNFCPSACWICNSLSSKILKSCYFYFSYSSFSVLNFLNSFDSSS